MGDDIMPPQPYYIPGYTGYCPQLKFRCGRNKSQESHLLLVDSEVAHSSRLVLANIHYEPPLMKNRHESTGDIARCGCCRNVICVYRPPIVPGYQGFLPRTQHFFGISESKAKTFALADFGKAKQERKEYHEKLMEAASYSTNCRPDTIVKITPSVLAEIKANL